MLINRVLHFDIPNRKVFLNLRLQKPASGVYLQLQLMPITESLLLTIGGWAVYGIGKISIAHIQSGYFTISMTVLLLIGIVVLVILQLNSSDSENN